MPVFQLSDELIFPSPECAEKDGLLAIGGDLTKKRLILAYSMGIFPWYSEGWPILWWSPDPRLVLLPGELKISRSLRQFIKKDIYKITLDQAFERVIRNCAEVHKEKDGGTWITDEMIEAYIKLHSSGYAHSVESWWSDELVGGLYGVSLGSAFFGESMFNKKDNASRVAFVKLARQLFKWNFELIDCQVTTKHLMNHGATEIRRREFMQLLEKSIQPPNRKGKWEFEP